MHPLKATVRPSAVSTSGWDPRTDRSMIDRRRWPRATGPGPTVRTHRDLGRPWWRSSVEVHRLRATSRRSGAHRTVRTSGAPSVRFVRVDEHPRVFGPRGGGGRDTVILIDTDEADGGSAGCSDC